jgi:hypothetical protein
MYIEAKPSISRQFVKYRTTLHFLNMISMLCIFNVSCSMLCYFNLSCSFFCFFLLALPMLFYFYFKLYCILNLGCSVDSLKIRSPKVEGEVGRRGLLLCCPSVQKRLALRWETEVL